MDEGSRNGGRRHVTVRQRGPSGLRRQYRTNESSQDVARSSGGQRRIAGRVNEEGAAFRGRDNSARAFEDDHRAVVSSQPSGCPEPISAQQLRVNAKSHGLTLVRRENCGESGRMASSQQFGRLGQQRERVGIDDERHSGGNRAVQVFARNGVLPDTRTDNDRVGASGSSNNIWVRGHNSVRGTRGNPNQPGWPRTGTTDSQGRRPGELLRARNDLNHAAAVLVGQPGRRREVWGNVIDIEDERDGFLIDEERLEPDVHQIKDAGKRSSGPRKQARLQRPERHGDIGLNVGITGEAGLGVDTGRSINGNHHTVANQCRCCKLGRHATQSGRTTDTDDSVQHEISIECCGQSDGVSRGGHSGACSQRGMASGRMQFSAELDDNDSCTKSSQTGSSKQRIATVVA